MGNGPRSRKPDWPRSCRVGSDCRWSRRSAQIANGSVGFWNIGNRAVWRDNIGIGAIATDEIDDGSILDADISATAGISDTKLATIATAGKVANSATTATTDNTAGTIVLRDVNGGFSAGTINAVALNGSGAGLTGLSASNITSGTVADARLSANIPRGGVTPEANTFTNAMTVTGNTYFGTADNTALVFDSGPAARFGFVKKLGFDPFLHHSAGLPEAASFLEQSNQTNLLKQCGPTLTEYMRIANGGNVGIGNAAPDNLLAIGTGINPSGFLPGISMGAAANRHFTIGQSSTNNVFLKWAYNATASNAYASLSTFGGSNPLALQESGGNVGIGTTSPTQARLVVNGGAGVGMGSGTYLQGTGGSTSPVILGSHALSIYATGGIVPTEGLYAVSDSRIRRLFDGRSDSAAISRPCAPLRSRTIISRTGWRRATRRRRK